MSELKIKINDIIIGKRSRKDFGDIEALAESIKEQGLLQSIGITSDKKLVFGYRRIKAFELLGRKIIEARIVNVTSIVEGEMTENEVRKSFTMSERVAIADAVTELIGSRQGQRTDLLVPNSAQVGNIEYEKGEKTREIAAKKAGFGGHTSYAEAKKLVREAPDLASQVDSGNKTLHRAVTEHKKRERLKQIEKVEPLPETKYRIIYADPPWKYNDELSVKGHTGAVHHYPTMSISELCDIPIIDMIEKDAILFLWVTSPLLEECFPVIKAWGFKYKTSFVWDKVRDSFGHYNSARHEFLLICTRGSCTPDTPKRHDSVQSIERTGKHSEKPERFRELIDSMYPRGKRIELFPRVKVKGWDSWGAEA